MHIGRKDRHSRARRLISPAVKILAIATSAVMAFAAHAQAAASINLAWDPSADLDIAGYRVHYGSSSGAYPNVLDVGNANTAAISNLTTNTTYFVVTAYNSANLESLPSNEISFTTAQPPPPPPPNQPPTVQLALSTSLAALQAPADVTLLAQASDSDGSVVKVEFYSGATKLGQAIASPFTYTWNGAPAGNYNLTAIATDNAGATTTSNVASLSVASPPPPPPPNQPPTVQLALSTSLAALLAPANVTLLAQASDVDGSVVKVEFYNGATRLGQSLASPYTYTWSGAPAGNYTITAIATDNTGAATTSNAVSLSVASSPPPPPPPPSTAPSISSFTYATKGSGQITILGTPGSTATLSVSSDMKAWSVLATATISTSGSSVIMDSAAATTQRRFYRVTSSQVTSDAFGVMKLAIPGTTRKVTSTLAYLSFPLTNSICYRGTIASFDAPSISATQATWVDGQFSGTNGEFYIEVTTGTRAGLTADIVGTQAPNHLVLAEDISPVLKGGESFVIRKHRTLGDVFGKDNEAKLKSGSTVSLADEVRVFDPVKQATLTFYYQAGAATGGTGWRASTDASTDASSTKLYLEQGAIVCHKAAGDVTLLLTGSVRTGPTIIPVGTGTNLIPNVYPAGLVTLGTSGLYTGNGSTGLTSGSTVTAADEVRIYDGKVLQSYFYKTGSGWRKAGSTTNVGSKQIPIGGSVYVIRKSSRAAFNWTAAQPF